jgi:hypothetical protein
VVFDGASVIVDGASAAVVGPPVIVTVSVVFLKLFIISFN